MSEVKYLLDRTVLSAIVAVWMVFAVLVKFGFSQEAFTSNTTTIVEGVEFGEVKTFITTEDHVYHIEVDIMDVSRLLFSDGSALKTTDDVRTVGIAGSASQTGYTEAIGRMARFNKITGFTQLNHTTVLAVDQVNRCVRLINRRIRKTSPFVGKCRTSGFRNGLRALFTYPRSVIKDPKHPNKLLITDEGAYAVRQIDIRSRVTTTIISRSAGLVYPKCLMFDPLKENLIVSSEHRIMKCNPVSKKCVKFAGSGTQGFADGALEDAEFSTPLELIRLSDSVTLVANREDSKLRVLNTANDSVSSICSDSTGEAYQPALACSLDSPQSLMARDGIIYVGEYRAIRSIEYVSPVSEEEIVTEAVCPDDITTVISPDQTSTLVSWVTPYGVVTNMTLQIGDKHIVYTLKNGTECHLTISVIHESKTCPDADMALMAEEETNTALFSIMASTGEHELRLPVGAYDYYYKDGRYGNCSTRFIVVDNRVRRRLDFKAQYDIKCAELQDESVFTVFESSAQLTNEIREICDGECVKAGNVLIDCENDTTTLTWPTDLILLGNVAQLSEHVQNKIHTQLANKYLLKVLLHTHTPPIIYPVAGVDGLSARSELTTLCLGGYLYNSTTTLCVKQP